MLVHLFDDWTHIVERLHGAPVIALFLDFDGTLAHIQPRPEQVTLDARVRRALTTLALSPRFRVWIISGRRRADIRYLVRVPGIRYLGLHGWEGRASATIASETHRWLSALTAWLKALLAPIAGVWVEDKELAVAVHYRNASEQDARVARALLDRVIAPFAAQFRVESGKRVWEILPWELEDKGAAVKHELGLLAGRALPVYVGDDQVDESAFASVPAGVTVRVGGSGATHAQYRLSGVPEVGVFLDKLAAEIA